MESLAIRVYCLVATHKTAKQWRHITKIDRWAFKTCYILMWLHETIQALWETISNFSAYNTKRRDLQCLWMTSSSYHLGPLGLAEEEAPPETAWLWTISDSQTFRHCGSHTFRHSVFFKDSEHTVIYPHYSIMLLILVLCHLITTSSQVKLAVIWCMFAWHKK